MPQKETIRTLAVNYLLVLPENLSPLRGGFGRCGLWEAMTSWGGALRTCVRSELIYNTKDWCPYLGDLVGAFAPSAMWERGKDCHLQARNGPLADAVFQNIHPGCHCEKQMSIVYKAPSLRYLVIAAEKDKFSFSYVMFWIFIGIQRTKSRFTFFEM